MTFDGLLVVFLGGVTGEERCKPDKITEKEVSNQNFVATKGFTAT